MAKIAATSVLLAGSVELTMCWFAVECVVMLAIKTYAIEGTFRFNAPGLDGLVPSAMINLMYYLGAVACPIPYLRFPGELRVVVLVQKVI
jgi:hypothetical protein